MARVRRPGVRSARGSGRPAGLAGLATKLAIAATLVTTAACSGSSAAQSSGDDQSAGDRPRFEPTKPCMQPPSPIVQSGTPRLHPEGTVWDPTRSRVLVGSLHRGSVSIVNPDGTTTPLVKDPRLIGTGGMRIDRERNRLLVTYDDTFAGPGGQLSERSTPKTPGKWAGLGFFDLSTGKTIKLIDLGYERGLHLSNDLALDPEGNAYVTDSFNGTIYRVDPDGNRSVFLKHPKITAPIKKGIPDVGPNGIIYRDGYLVIVRYDTGDLFKIPIRDPESVTKVKLDRPVAGADGMVQRPNGDLVAVTNTIRSYPGAIEGVIVVRSDDGWRTARRVSTTPWPDNAPTMVAMTPCADYVLSSRLDVLFHSAGKTTSDGFNLRRFDK
jgi:sugar lactone lactonase YvrE